MTSYTPEQIRQCISWLAGNFRVTADGKYRECADILAATLKAAQGGVTEAMVDVARDAYAKSLGYQRNPHAHPMYADAMRAALEAALSAQQGEGEKMPVPCSVDRTHPNKACITLGFYDEAACDRFYKAITRGKDLFTAPPAQPAERVPEGWRVLQIGAVGSAYDPPNTRRAFTYDWQPGNGGAWALGKASSAAAKASAGDYIDSGLSLLKALQEQGFGVFQIDPSASPIPSPARGDGGDARSHRWDEDGERCVVCGDKDWMGGPCNGPRTATTQDTRP